MELRAFFSVITKRGQKWVRETVLRREGEKIKKSGLFGGTD